MFALKALSLFLLGLLLINPKIKTIKTENSKPVLSFLVDNSLSTKHFKEETSVKNILQNVKTHKELNSKFDVNYYSFGKNITVLDSLSFNETQTDIAKAVQSANDLNKDGIGASVLISDGNQTVGNDYEFINIKQPVYPLVIGDTTQFQDLRISQLNVNKYSYIKNKFPVEVMLFYDGKEPLQSVFTITQGGKSVFSEKVSFSAEKKTKTITANLTAAKEGIQYFTAGIRAIKSEKNTKNNFKSFAVEVIDEQTKVLIVSSILHPDLGALKKSIERNKQRKVDLKLVHNFKGTLEGYQMVVFYQPNTAFRRLFEQRKSNFVIISGTKTDWNFINSLPNGIRKNAINQTENYGAVYNAGFSTFLQKDLQFGNLPPLQDKFGDVTIEGEHQTLLYQKLVNIETKQPLLTTLEKGGQKLAILFGEGIWKWRAASFLEENSFEPFDEFIGNLVQYVASNKKRKRLEVNAERIYPANATINISALYLDKNYQFDKRASMQIVITNSKTKEKKQFPFSLLNNSYKVDVDGLLAGNYTYKVTVEGQNLSVSGQFKVTDYQVEEQFTNANTDKLQKLALKSSGKLFYKNQSESLINELLNDKRYYTTQKSIVKEENLINWKWLLFVIVGLLTIEWFTRKYFGKI